MNWYGLDVCNHLQLHQPSARNSMIQPLLASFSSLQLRLTGCWLGNVASGVPPGRFSQLYEDSVHSGPTRVVCPERLSVKTQ